MKYLTRADIVMHIKMNKILPISGNRQGLDQLPSSKGEGRYQGETVLRQLL